ncbi:hypothetical protein BaRGS_00000476 [Batillaria attramentaria]|uniref:15-hydroxyprostaglandin dehydrogenase [NAD(+)] n=1 Tax=Batillaria attramentaria TaxID=370345 RepID=A0ABD0M9J0_9CAEN
MDLTGKRVFLTGGNRGLGRAIMEALLSEGARVYFCSLQAEKGKSLEAELQDRHGSSSVFFRQCDVSDADQLKKTFDDAVSKLGWVDICINNAGIMDERKMEDTIAVNAVAQIRGSQLALDHMRRDRGGRGGVIINVVSETGFKPVYWVPVYTASKHAVLGFTTSWAKNPRMSEMGVRWRCVCVGSVDTDMIHPTEEGQMVDQSTFVIPFALLIEMSEYVAAFLKMLRDQAHDDVIFEIQNGTGGRFRKRQIVDSDGVSNPVTVD